jgi:hypothetical protein
MSLGKFMMTTDKHLQYSMLTGRSVLIYHMSLKPQFYHQGD